MKTTAKQIQRSNITFAFKDAQILPEPAQVFALYPGSEGKGSLFSDNVSMATRVFELPARKIQWVFEPTRVRLEETGSIVPAESKLAEEIVRAYKVLYPQVAPSMYGFNYDTIHRMSTVIPVPEIMGAFLSPETVELTKEFGWQYTLTRDKGKRAETYFFKMVSPIEFAVHANFHFNSPGIPDVEELQKAFEHCYATVDACFDQLSF